ncbi:hypothetical protein J3459_011352 [Metarhizium acridum]|nr:hypothetical protein J3459_011352 [Metarhizium acridum]
MSTLWRDALVRRVTNVLFLLCRVGETKYKTAPGVRVVQMADLDVVAEETFFFSLRRPTRQVANDRWWCSGGRGVFAGRRLGQKSESREDKVESPIVNVR